MTLPGHKNTFNKVKASGFSVTGLVRSRNEDSALIESTLVQDASFRLHSVELQTPGWIAVADGLGGHAHGNVASQTLLYSLISEDPPFKNQEDLNEFGAFLSAKLVEKSRELHDSDTMASTFTGLYITEDHIHLIHCGDCRAYRVDRDDESHALLTIDHTMVFQDYLRGELFLEQVRTHPMKNRLTRCIQAREEIPQLDHKSFPLKKGMRFLLVSDGIWESMHHEQLMRQTKDGPIQECCESVYRSYWESGARDNGSLVLLET